jgi:Tol biopolymer transport system component
VDITWRGRTDIYVYDLARSVRRRLTHTGFNIDPLWTPDGSALVFRSTRRDSGGQNIFRVAADASGEPELLLDSKKDKIPGSWARNGSLLAYTDISARRKMTIGVLDLAAGSAELLLDSPYNVGWPVFSPDGRWLAYTSTESGRTEVWVRRFPEAGPGLQVTVDGGSEPLWASDGTRLYFRRGDQFLAVEADRNEGVRPHSVRELFRGRFDASPTGHQHYDVDAQGRFAAIALENATDPEMLHLVIGWDAELERIVDRGR